MDKFAIKFTEVYFSKARLKLFKVLTIILVSVIAISDLYWSITGYILNELKLFPFIGSTFSTIFLMIVLAAILFYLTIKTADRSYKGSFEINDNGLKFNLNKNSRKIPWSFIKSIEISSEDWKFETKKKTFWIEFDNNYERYKADALIRENANGRQLIKSETQS
jgi:hypothetical protein